MLWQAGSRTGPDCDRTVGAIKAHNGAASYGCCCPRDHDARSASLETRKWIAVLGGADGAYGIETVDEAYGGCRAIRAEYQARPVPVCIIEAGTKGTVRLVYDLDYCAQLRSGG